MSKYIDELTELICDTVRTVFPNASLDDGYDVADEVIAKLPTIEVSEEVLKATKNFNAYTIADENAEMGMRTQIEPVIEVSEDCISREWVRENMLKYGFLAPDMTVHEFIEDAPSVVPKQSELTEAYIRGYKDGAEQSLETKLKALQEAVETFT